MVDPGELENALLNLTINARDAMPKGGTLTIATKFSTLGENYPPVQAQALKPGHYAHITISDTGCGMSRETRDRVFEPFFTTKPRGKGTGLGLSMVYGFAKQSGGYVSVYSELGHGTSVSLYLPLAEGVSVPVKALAITPKAKISGVALVVDDEVDLLEIAVAYLEEMGFRVFQALDSISALSIVEREPRIDLLVTDIVMPGGMNGVELANSIHQLKPNIKIVYLSGFPSERLAEKSGMQVKGPLLRKPYQKQEFIDFIHRAMINGNSQLKGDGMEEA